MALYRSLIWAGSLNHSKSTADASSEHILKAAFLIAIFKSKCQWWAGIHPPAHCHRKMTTVNKPVGVSKCFPVYHCHFDLKIHVLLAALTVALNYLKIQLCSMKCDSTLPRCQKNSGMLVTTNNSHYCAFSCREGDGTLGCLLQ